ncbi:MAG: lysoplasmalogenase [Anaerolineae bacterium]
MTVFALPTPAVVALTLGLIFAVVDWVAVIRRAKRLEYVFKPLTLLVVIVGAWLLRLGSYDPRLLRWFLPALALSLLGDVFLMLPDKRWFLWGLASFLAAHLFYIVGLTPSLPPRAALWLVLPIVALDVVVLRRIVAGVVASGSEAMRGPVIAYGAILSLTLFAGWATWFRAAWPLAGRITASVGATLFFLSDLMLAWDRFVERSHLLHVLVLVTYHLAQIALALTIATAA